MFVCWKLLSRKVVSSKQTPESKESEFREFTFLETNKALSRQFLFRDWNMGQVKSTVAASAAALINPHLMIEAWQNRVSPETENVFDETFWEHLTAVIIALN